MRAASLIALAALTGCSLRIHGQELPAHARRPVAAEFTPARRDVAVLHYYGSGGWGIGWQGTYLLAAPYFSNHSLEALVAGTLEPDLAAIRDGFAGTPVGKTSMILVGHGHIDHAGDVPAFFGPGLIEPGNKPALVADESTSNLLAPYHRSFGCIAELGYDAGGKPVTKCPIDRVEITPIHSAHAPHLRFFGVDVSAYDGTVKKPRKTPPSKAQHYRVGNTWAFLIDLKNERGDVVFRIHYMDAAAAPPHGMVPADVLAKRQVDVHIGCVPGFDSVDDYPDAALLHHNVHYVFGAHWEDFFKPRNEELLPVRVVLTAGKMETFIDHVERALGKAPRGGAPINKSAAACAAPGTCGPHGANWTVPVPGETFQFVTGAPRLPPLPEPDDANE